MKVVGKKDELSKSIKEAGLSPVGFVPTMGALHQGHISLVENAVSQCPLAVVSIYVNPTQFNDKNDLLNYPRCLPDDLDLLGSVLRENDIVFAPDDREMYPEEDKRVFNFGNLDNVMEALHRPGHFNGVAQVVSKLFNMVNPDIAFFGQKDFQQVAVIRELVRQTGSGVKITACPIIREKDGLAMSSRNQLLEPNIRKEASVIYASISSAAAKISDHDIPSLKNFVKREIEAKEGFSLEYFEIVDDRELIPVASRKEMEPGKRYFGCIAVRAGKIRLIDNIEIPL
ncbi:MAG TPA: pantoate--beta-alanine ligase [Bacteroidales bacterium]|jgi:pantoate--beta-alanine ligase|nr:pantoate--beta-alanine ligase [Bacteroidales bacterium]